MEKIVTKLNRSNMVVVTLYVSDTESSGSMYRFRWVRLGPWIRRKGTHVDRDVDRIWFTRARGRI